MKLSIKTTDGKEYIFQQYCKEVEVSDEHGEIVTNFPTIGLRDFAISAVWKLCSRDVLLDLAHQFIHLVFLRRGKLGIPGWRNERLEEK